MQIKKERDLEPMSTRISTDPETPLQDFWRMLSDNWNKILGQTSPVDRPNGLGYDYVPPSEDKRYVMTHREEKGLRIAPDGASLFYRNRFKQR